MSRWFGVNCYLAEEARSRTSTSAMIAAKTTRCMADTLLPFALCQAHRWLGSRARSLYLYPAHPTTLYWPAWRVPGTVRAYGRPGSDLRGLFLKGHGGSSAALVVQQEDAIRNAADPFDTGVREYSEKELACSGSEATEGKSELSALIICFAALLMAGVRLICLAGRRRSVPLSQGAHPLQDAPPPHHQGSSKPPPVPKRMGSGPERIFTRPRAPSSGRSASDA